MTPKIQVVCSDQARNGKTLLTRLLADYLTLVGRETTVFDAEFPHSGVRMFLPERTRLVDLSKIAGQMTMIDNILGTPPQDYVIDLPSRLLTDTFHLFDQIDFAGEARRKGFYVLVYYIVDRPFASLRMARQIYNAGQMDRFVPVRNEAVGHVSDHCNVVNLYGEIAQEGEIAMPLLERGIVQFVEQRGFSFCPFLLNRYTHVPGAVRVPLRSFINDNFAQIRAIHGHVEAHGLRRLGLV